MRLKFLFLVWFTSLTNLYDWVGRTLFAVIFYDKTILKKRSSNYVVTNIKSKLYITFVPYLALLGLIQLDSMHIITFCDTNLYVNCTCKKYDYFHSWWMFNADLLHLEKTIDYLFKRIHVYKRYRNVIFSASLLLGTHNEIAIEHLIKKVPCSIMKKR